MADIKRYPVLTAIYSLRGHTMDRKPSVIKVSDIVRLSGLPKKEVDRVLAENEGSLKKNDKGKLIGADLLSASCKEGLIILRREGVRGSTLLRQYFVKGVRAGGNTMSTAPIPAVRRVPPKRP